MSITTAAELRAIDAVRKGDAERFEELVRAYEKEIYNLCLRMLGNEQDALDASQEAFFKAYRALGSFRGESRFSTWLYRLASNTCVDILRRRPGTPFLSLDEEDDIILPPIADSRRSPQEIAESKELRAMVDRALDTLAPEFRQAVILRDVVGLSYEEIGSVMELEPGTVKSRIFRARKKLAAVLSADGNFSGYYASKTTGKTRGKGGARV